jgi:hypothetical protein
VATEQSPYKAVIKGEFMQVYNNSDIFFKNSKTAIVEADNYEQLLDVLKEFDKYIIYSIDIKPISLKQSWWKN